MLAQEFMQLTVKETGRQSLEDALIESDRDNNEYGWQRVFTGMNQINKSAFCVYARGISRNPPR